MKKDKMVSKRKMVIIVLMICLLGCGSDAWAMTKPQEGVTDRLYSDNQVQDTVIAGNRVYFEITVPKGTVVKEGMIGKNPVEFVEKEKDGCVYFQGTIRIEASDFREGERFTAKALLITEEQSIVYTSNDYLTFYAPPRISNLEWHSENPNPFLIKNGENLMVSFNVSHLSTVQVFAGDRKVSMDSEDGIHYNGRIQADGLAEDQKRILLKVMVSDAFGNQPMISEIETVRYFAPLVLYEMNQESTNKIDSQNYIIDGDQLILKGKVNHAAEIHLKSGGQILENQSEKTDFEFRLPIEQFEKEDQKFPIFEIIIRDAAGHCIEGIDGTVCENRLCYYAPIIYRAETKGPDCKTPGYVKNGMSLKTEIKANHEVRLTQVSYNGLLGIVEKKQGESVCSTYIIASQEMKMEEGDIYLNAILEDVAGNRKVIEEKTDWIYDRTPPKGMINPQREGFFNQDLSFRIHFRDAALDLESFELETNDQNQDLNAHLTEEGAEATFNLKKEGRYHCVCRASDLAGNLSEACHLKVVIDKTLPQIVGIDIKTDCQPIYPAGFILSEHFKVKETYLKEIQCTLTDRWGFGRTRIWNMDRPIMEDGLKKASFKATDLASNVSEQIGYEFYIDGTAPKIKVTDKNKEKPIEDGECILKGTVLEFTLDPRWLEGTHPDRFEEIRGKIGGKSFEYDCKALEKKSLQLRADTLGELVLNIKAMDDAGNRTQESMTLSVKEKKALGEISKNHLPTDRTMILKRFIRIALIAGCVAGVLIVCYLLFKRYFWKNRMWKKE